MKRLSLTALLMFCLTAISAPAGASWLIDPGKLHVSVHGQTGCQDCHDGIADRTLHPDPSNVNRRSEDLFDPDHCLACHDDVTDSLAEGRHGSKQVLDAAEYERCLQCHHPHEQLAIHDEDGYDPAKSPWAQCGVCHEPQSKLPPPSAEDEGCRACHVMTEPMGTLEKSAADGLCFHCHGESGTAARELTAQAVSPVNPQEFQASSHGAFSCLECHQRAVSYPHNDQSTRECLACHVRHGEKTAHDAHLGVACQACHLKNITPVKDQASQRIVWVRKMDGEPPAGIHDFSWPDDEKHCARCHFSGNRLGAATRVLPPKGILCMPCHTATLTLGDMPSILAAIVFLGGLMILFSYWFTGSVAANPQGRVLEKWSVLAAGVIRAVCSPKIVAISQALVLDVLLQRRLYRRSKKRWAIHGLIFFPFVFRFGWGLISLLGSRFQPQWSAVWHMIDKNDSLTAFLFDLTGLMILTGLVLALVRGASKSPDSHGVARQDRPALFLIGGLVIVGFILEGLRLAMTGSSGRAAWAFIGYGIGRLFSGPADLTGIYGYVWYLHAALNGLFIAYLPFSRLLHVIMAPIVLLANAGRGDRK